MEEVRGCELAWGRRRGDSADRDGGLDHPCGGPATAGEAEGRGGGARGPNLRRPI